MRTIALALTLLLCGLSLVPACDEPIPPVPASSDPEGKDFVKGAVVAAAESSGGIRLYKVVHVDDYPKPLGWELHMIAYDPKASTFQDAAILWQKKTGLTVALDYVNVRLVDFLPRDHRILKVEPVSDEEMKPYKRALESRQRYNR
jgi:hypothetical protein